MSEFTQEIDMIGLRRAAPDRQGNPMPRTTRVQERPPLRSENTKIVASGPFSPRISAKSMLSNFLRGVIVVRSQYLPWVNHFNKTRTDSWRKRGKNSAQTSV
jgi:hypothetical protein